MKLERYLEAKNYVYSSFKTGFNFIDNNKAIGIDDFVVIAGSTGSAKTYMAMFMAMNAARDGARVLYINAEILAHEFVTRMINMKFNFERDFGEFDQYGRNRFMAIHQEDSQDQITFNKVDEWVNMIRPDLLVIDLFGCMIPPGGHIPTLTREYASAYSFYPKKYKCAVIVTEQLSKENRGVVRPDENCIANGKALSDKATKIITLYSYYRANPHKAAIDCNTTVNKSLEMIVKKDRSSRLPIKIYLTYMEDGFRDLLIHEHHEYMDVVFKENKK